MTYTVKMRNFMKSSRILSLLLVFTFLAYSFNFFTVFAEDDHEVYNTIQVNDSSYNEIIFEPDSFEGTGMYQEPGPIPEPPLEIENKGKARMKELQNNESLRTLDATPSLTVTNITPTTLTLNAVYPCSGWHGNGLFVQNTVTGVWTDVSGTWSTVDGSYTATGLNPGTSYRCHLIWYADSTHTWYGQAIDVYVSTTSVPEVLYQKVGNNVILSLESYDTAAFQGSNYDRWVSHLDATYNAYRDLVGFTPNSGQKMEIRSTRTYPGGWAVAGYPILWYQQYVKEALQRSNDSDDWSFGIMHEISHNFDNSKWNFHSEFWANFKLYYASEMLGAKTYMNKWYTGAELAEYFRADAQESYTKTIALGNFHHDGLLYCFIRLKNQIGWQPFKDTFRYLTSLSSSQIPSTNIGKFNLYMTKLKAYSGVDVLSTFSASEKQVIGTGLGGTVEYMPDTVNLKFSNISSSSSFSNALPSQVNESPALTGYSINGYTLVKVSDLTKYLGATLSVDSTGNKWTIARNGLQIVFTNNSAAYTSTMTYSIKKPDDGTTSSYTLTFSGVARINAQVIGGVKYVDLRRASEQLGALIVGYDNSTSTALVFDWRVNSSTPLSDENSYLVGGPWLTNWSSYSTTNVSTNFAIGELSDNTNSTENPDYYTQFKMSVKQIQCAENVRYHYNSNSSMSFDCGFRSWIYNCILKQRGYAPAITSLHMRGRAWDAPADALYSPLYTEFKGTDTTPVSSGNMWITRVYSTGKSGGYRIEKMESETNKWLHLDTPRYGTSN